MLTYYFSRDDMNEYLFQNYGYCNTVIRKRCSRQSILGSAIITYVQNASQYLVNGH